MSGNHEITGFLKKRGFNTNHTKLRKAHEEENIFSTSCSSSSLRFFVLKLFSLKKTGVLTLNGARKLRFLTISLLLT